MVLDSNIMYVHLLFRNKSKYFKVNYFNIIQITYSGISIVGRGGTHLYIVQGSESIMFNENDICIMVFRIRVLIRGGINT